MPQIGPIQQPTYESFCGNTEELKRAKHMPAFLPIGIQPAAMRVSGLSRDAHNRVVIMLIELGMLSTESGQDALLYTQMPSWRRRMRS